MLGSDLNLLGYTVFSNKPLPEWKKAYYIPRKVVPSSHCSFFFCGELTEALCFGSVLGLLKEKYPEMVLWIFTDSQSQEVFEGNPYVDRLEVIPFEKWRKLQWDKALEDMLGWINYFRHGVGQVYNFSERPAAALLANLLGGRRSYGLLMDSEGRAFIAGNRWMQYAIEVMYPALSDGILYEVNLLTRRHMFLWSLGLEDVDKRLQISSVVEQEPADLTLSHSDCYIAVCPYAPYEARIWPAEYWLKLIDQVYKEFGCKILLLLPGSYSMELKSRNYLYKLEGLNLRQMAYYLARSRLFISTHNSYIHLSGLLQVPTLVVCGERNQGPEFEGLHLSVRRYVPCSPCYSHHCLRKYCLLGLSPEVVFRLVKFLWSSIEKGGFVIEELRQDSIWRMLEDEIVVEVCDQRLPSAMSKYVSLGKDYTQEVVARIVRLGFLHVWNKANGLISGNGKMLDFSGYMDWALEKDINWEKFLEGINYHVKFLTEWEQKLNLLILRLRDTYCRFPFFFARKRIVVDPENLWESLVNFDSSLPALLKKLVDEIDDDPDIPAEEKIRSWIAQKRVLLDLIREYRQFLEDFLFSEPQNSDKIQHS